MERVSRVSLGDVETTLFIKDEEFYIIFDENEDVSKTRDFWWNPDHEEFLLEYETTAYTNIAVVREFSFPSDRVSRLDISKEIRRFRVKKFSSMEVSGDAIDDFFNPVSYYQKTIKNTGKKEDSILYSAYNADKWSIDYQNTTIKVDLIYGDILGKGVFSDLKIHPKLIVSFPETDSVEMISAIYQIIIRFLRLIRYDAHCGDLRVDLYYEDSGQKNHNGRFIQRELKYTREFINSIQEIEYTSYRPYIQQYLQFAANSKEYCFAHFPKEPLRFRGKDYSNGDFIQIFSAFEKECRMQSDKYESVATSKLDSIRKDLLDRISNVRFENLNREEEKFVKQAYERISQLGTQIGQKQKIINAYIVNKQLLRSSIDKIFSMPDFHKKEELLEEDINKVAGYLTEIRGKIAHGDSVEFSDLDAQKIKYLEIITHVMLLQRIGLKEEDVERIIGSVFRCNYIMWEEKFNI